MTFQHKIIYQLVFVGGTTNTPLYSKRAYTTRSAKNSALIASSRSFVYGLHEPWEWYDKCAKRKRNHGKRT